MQGKTEPINVARYNNSSKYYISFRKYIYSEESNLNLNVN